MIRLFCFCGAGLGFLGVACGAFGAHALRARLSAENLAIFQTGVLYHLLHSLALLLTAVWAMRTPHPILTWAGGLFLAGIIVFSGSLYLLALTNLRLLGAVTPLGGVAFLAAWGCLARAAFVALPN